MCSSVSPQPGRWRARVRSAASVAALLTAAAVAATPRVARAALQQDTTSRAASRARSPAAKGVRGAQAQNVVSGLPRMPYLVGLDTLRAISRLRRLDVSHWVILPPGRDSIPLDLVAAQRPESGAVLRPSVDTVRLTLAGRARPQELVRVPYVVGATQGDATAALERARLVPQLHEEPTAITERIGRVVRQAPDSGRPLQPGSDVAIWVGRDARVVMPPVTGYTLAVASRMLREAGVRALPKARELAGDGEAIDSVVEQAPAAGTPVPPDTVAVLTLGRRPAQTARVPYVVGLDSAAAIRRLVAAGLGRHQLRSARDGSAANVVGTQSPDSGRRVPITTTVVLTLRARGVDTALVPLVVGLTVDSATRVLRAAHLRALVDASGGAARHARDTVRRQSPGADAIAIRGEAVTIVPAHRFAWTPLIILLLLGGGGVVAALGARAVWPPPTIAPRVRLHPYAPRLTRAGEPFIGASVSLRSRIVHHEPRLRCAGSLLA